MATSNWFVDTSVFLLAAGADHPLQADAKGFLQHSRQTEATLNISVEALQEFSFHRLRRVDRSQALEESEALARSVVLHPFDQDTMLRAFELMRTTPLRGKDAVHAATALLAGFSEIVSCDRDFDHVPGLRRVDPRDAVT